MNELNPSGRIGSGLTRRSVPVKVSFEFFPPGDEKMEQTLWQSIQRLLPLSPRFVSVTYGADGSTRERTHQVVMRVLKETSLTPAPHLTCVGTDREQVLDIARSYWRAGVRHIVALRGDAPQGSVGYRPHPGGFAYAVDLVRGLKSVADFEISVAAFPEGHPEAPSAAFDLDNLRAKTEAGADRAITQFFFDSDVFLRFRDRCAAAGIRATLVPGILPITRFPQMLRFAQRCGTTVPDWLRHRFDGLEEDPDTRRMIAAAFAIGQVETLSREGVDEFHFYTLNRADLTFAICHALGVRAPQVEPPARLEQPA
ncbi:MAG TPA: methylenetetrahydrofolate reductase [Steroidobacteraceae bacterium]|nr:methylenetetrahydrofolate reductase [Steroidobacteraceae bacterium]